MESVEQVSDPSTAAGDAGQPPQWRRRIVLAALLVGIAAAIAGSEQSVPVTPASVALIAACGGGLVALTLLARATFAPTLPGALVGVCAFMAAFCGYGAGLYWWNHGLLPSWPFFAWGAIVGPLPMAMLAIPRAVRHVLGRSRVYWRRR